MSPTAFVWFHSDLRLEDNPAMAAAVKRGGLVIPVFIWSPREEGEWAPGAASRWWLHQSLTRLSNALRKSGSQLVIRRGDTLATLTALARETRANAIFWNARHEPAVAARDTQVQKRLRASGLDAQVCNANLLFAPGTVLTREGKPFQVFTPFWKACLSAPEPVDPLPAPKRLPFPKEAPESLPLSDLELEPKVDWAGGMRAAWHPSAEGAMALLDRFLEVGLTAYNTARERPDLIGTSRLSPHLHFGEISPRQVWHLIRERITLDDRPGLFEHARSFLRQLGWREFAHHLLHHFPHTPTQPLREQFRRFPWSQDTAPLRDWQRGRTGYPLVDAGMRELWSLGWMHNRVRMVVASFLVKDLLLPWQEGTRWFWDTLVDADLANNTIGWQWAAGCGADAAPYFRIFNPVTQGEKFDSNGDYVRHWVPELARLPNHWIHRPWDAPGSVLADAGVKLRETYPQPIVDHDTARRRALVAFAKIKQDANAQRRKSKREVST